MKVSISVLFIIIAHTGLSQGISSSILNGKINANTIDLDGIYVINLKTEKSTITENGGYFSIEVKSGDTLLFSAVHIKEHKICLEQKDIQEELFLVNLEVMITRLNEVLIKRYDNINAVALGISPSGIKHRTQLERKLYTANSTTGDALLNLMSGRTAMIKKEIEVEKKLSFISEIENMFDDEYFRKKLKIPSEYIKGFKFYVVENNKFTVLLKDKNKTIIEFLIGELAVKYNEIIACENE